MVRKKVFKIGKKIFTCFLTLSISVGIMAGCSGKENTKKVYNPETRVALNENEIKYQPQEQETYYNYIELFDPAGNIYQIGDPYVLRYNGKYYLYTSTTTGHLNAGIPCWVSDNLVDWTWGAWAYGDATTCDQYVNTAFAPEVIYYKGFFYLCEAPKGQGHYVFRSDSPLGPFERVSDNLGLGIDGSFYVAPDDELYLISAIPSKGIAYTRLQFDEEGRVTADLRSRVISSANLKGWTEGPGYFVRNGYKYLVYTGNDVNSAGYRVAYSYTQANSLFDDLKTRENNITLLSTGDIITYGKKGYNSADNYVNVENYRGLGHSSNFTGPNLDSVYTAYHNAGRTNYNDVVYSEFNRRMNVAQYYTNNSYVLTNSLATFDVAKPTLPDYSAAKEDLEVNGNISLSREKTKEVFTAEMNFTAKDGGGTALIGYADGGNEYTEITLSGAHVTVSSVIGDKKTLLAEAEVAEYDNPAGMHTVKVINGYGKAEVYFNGKLVAEISPVSAGKIGYRDTGETGATQFTNDAFGTSDFESVKNLTGSFPAYTYLKGENRGFSFSNAAVSPSGVRQGEKETTFFNEEYVGVTIREDEWVKYAVNAPAQGTYALNCTIGKGSEGCVFDVIIDETHIYKMEVTDCSFGDAQYINYNAGVFDILSSGVHSMKIRVFDGTLNLINLSTTANAERLDDFSEPLTSERNGITLIGNAAYTANGWVTSESDSKSLLKFGNTGLSDYSVSVDVSVESGKGGILLRTKNFSHTSRQNLTDNQMQGYLVCVDQNIVSLVKYNYNLKTLDSKVAFSEDGSRIFSNGKTNKLTAQIIKNVISVYVNDQLLITYVDADAFTDGYWGLYSDGGKLTFENLTYKNL